MGKELMRQSTRLFLKARQGNGRQLLVQSVMTQLLDQKEVIVACQSQNEAVRLRDRFQGLCYADVIAATDWGMHDAYQRHQIQPVEPWFYLVLRKYESRTEEERSDTK